MDLNKQIDKTISQIVALKLQQYNFNKSGRVFWRGKEQITDIISFQKAPHNSAEKSDFTINLGVYWHDIQKDIGWNVPKWPPKEYDCTVFQRIGFIFNNNCDYWWETTKNSDFELIGNDVAEKIITYGINWLEEGHDIRVVLQRARKHYYRQQMDKVENSIKHIYGIN